jgi:hypothetical protein
LIDYITQCKERGITNREQLVIGMSWYGCHELKEKVKSVTKDRREQWMSVKKCERRCCCPEVMRELHVS